MTELLKLDFNERSDQANPLTEAFSYGESLWLYPDREPLESKIASLNNLQPKQVLCTNGGDEAIMILMRILSERKKLILPLPAFSQYTWGVESWKLDATVVEAKSDLAIDVKQTLAQIKKVDNSITIITRPNNPTGEAIALEELVSVLETSKQNNGWVFLDEAYIEFSDFESAAESLLSQYDNLIILRTFSKAYGLAGIRLGYILASEKLIEEFRIRCMPFNIPAPSLQIAEQALEPSNQQEMLNYCKAIRVNREQLVSWLKQQAVHVFPSQANFVMINLPANMAQAVKSFLKKNNILVRSFDSSDSFELQNCLRITVPINMEKLMAVLKQCFSPQLICMDMDGVLIDTSGSYDQAVLATVKKLSEQVISLESVEALRRQGGYNNDWVLSQKLLENLGITISLDDVTEVFQKIYLGENNDGLVSNETPLISSQFIDKINTLNQQQNLSFSVVTGRPRKEAQSGQAMVGLEKLDLVSLDDVKVGKPSPEGIQSLQQKYSKLSWMCGDNPDDMMAAVSSNSLAIGIGENKVNALYESGADIVLKSINELEEWLCRAS